MQDTERIKEKIEKENYRDMAGDFIDVDGLQKILKENGFNSGERGKGDLWYEVVAENSLGYIAVLEAKKDGVTRLFTVDSQSGKDGIIVGVKVE